MAGVVMARTVATASGRARHRRPGGDLGCTAETASAPTIAAGPRAGSADDPNADDPAAAADTHHAEHTTPPPPPTGASDAHVRDPVSADSPTGFFASPPTRIRAGSQGRVCMSCGTINDQRRELCGRCGADLDTGRELPHLAPRDAGMAPPPAAVVRRRRRWVWPILAILLAAGLAFAGLVLAEVGPFSPQIALPEAEFDPQVYADEPAGIRLSDLAAATILADESGSYDPRLLVDEDPQTAWRSDPEQLPGDAPETLELTPERPIWLAAIELRNGDHASTAAYDRSSRVRQALIRVDGGATVLVELLDAGLHAQRFDLERPLLTTSIRIEVLDAFQGEQDSLAISDLEVVGWVATGEDVTLAQQRAELLPAGDGNG